MILRTDTIGHFDTPTEENIRAAISYPDENVRENDLVKLMIDDENFVCVWIGKREVGHRLELRFGPTKVESHRRLDSEGAADILIRYLHGDMSWFIELTWDQPVVVKLLENLHILRMNQGSDPNQPME